MLDVPLKIYRELFPMYCYGFFPFLYTMYILGYHDLSLVFAIIDKAGLEIFWLRILNDQTIGEEVKNTIKSF